MFEEFYHFTMVTNKPTFVSIVVNYAGEAEMEIDLHKDASAFIAAKADLLAEKGPKWVVFHEGKFQGSFDVFADAYEDASQKFESGSFLIRNLEEAEHFVPVVCVSE